jgi:hypothetical protein
VSKRIVRGKVEDGERIGYAVYDPTVGGLVTFDLRDEVTD